MFVLSLAAAVYSYLFTWASGPFSISIRSMAIDAFLFSIFALHHSLFARESVKAYMARVVPDQLMRSVYVWIASLLLLLVLGLWHRVGGEAYHATGWRAFLHGGVQLAGVWLIARAVAKIDALELAGIRQEHEASPLQVTGPYRWVRHPLYLGWLLVVFGAPHMTGDRLTFATITTIYLLMAVPWEERSLTRAFGEAYTRYKDRVRWRIVPYVY